MKCFSYSTRTSGDAASFLLSRWYRNSSMGRIRPIIGFIDEDLRWSGEVREEGLFDDALAQKPWTILNQARAASHWRVSKICGGTNMEMPSSSRIGCMWYCESFMHYATSWLLMTQGGRSGSITLSDTDRLFFRRVPLLHQPLPSDHAS
ncbi:hypothetical protein AC579_9360 [Pseudocercospora musae]|uniref:Uncharacterized protein n=1 Tax=Pseudocercospora musae TaxID=113226 RepID=A0A139I2I4_9PEZI|nr:hypothetical protein AC579_9360 [Pseudocercospora musae]